MSCTSLVLRCYYETLWFLPQTPPKSPRPFLRPTPSAPSWVWCWFCSWWAPCTSCASVSCVLRWRTTARPWPMTSWSTGRPRCRWDTCLTPALWAVSRKHSLFNQNAFISQEFMNYSPWCHSKPTIEIYVISAQQSNFVFFHIFDFSRTKNIRKRYPNYVSGRYLSEPTADY